MAKTLSNVQHQSLLLILGVLWELSTSETRPTQKAALNYCAGKLLEIVAPRHAPATATADPAPPQATVTAISAEAPKPKPTPAQRSAAAVKAAATRKANKNKSAGTVESNDATGSAPAASGDTAATE